MSLSVTNVSIQRQFYLLYSQQSAVSLPMPPPPPHAHEGDSNPADEMNDIPGVERHGNWTVVGPKRRPRKAMSFVRSLHSLFASRPIQNFLLTISLSSTYARTPNRTITSRSLSRPLKSNCSMHVPYEPRSCRIGDAITPINSVTTMSWT